MSWTETSSYAAQITTLLRQLAKAHEALAYVRTNAIQNLVNPGNEDDTLQYMIDIATGVLDDGYEFDYDREYDLARTDPME